MGIVFLVFFFVTALGSVMTSVAAHFILYVSQTLFNFHVVL